MKRKALVMGGGGIIGIAWETGLAAGLSANGLDLRTADLVVGTSAGSVVGTQLAHGFDPAQMLALQQLDMPGTGVSISQLNTGGTAAIFAKWFSATEMSEELCKEIGCMALELETMPEESWLSIFAMLAMDWPERPLKITAVEASTGTFTVWDRESGAPLQLAVASSCTVPGLFPPVTINGRRYVDGGVRSATNADLATGYDSVLIIAPMGVGAEGIAMHTLRREVAQLRGAGTAVEVVQPDQQAMTAFGVDLMDTAGRKAAAAEGLRQGREWAQRLAAIWG